MTSELWLKNGMFFLFAAATTLFQPEPSSGTAAMASQLPDVTSCDACDSCVEVLAFAVVTWILRPLPDCFAACCMSAQACVRRSTLTGFEMHSVLPLSGPAADRSTAPCATTTAERSTAATPTVTVPMRDRVALILLHLLIDLASTSGA